MTPQTQSAGGMSRGLAAAKIAFRGLWLASFSLTPEMVPEHERVATRTWQAEWPTMAAMIQATGAARASNGGGRGSALCRRAPDDAQNIDLVAGIIFAERAMNCLRENKSRADGCHKLLDEATGGA